jgi:hypothetical protein
MLDHHNAKKRTAPDAPQELNVPDFPRPIRYQSPASSKANPAKPQQLSATSKAPKRLDGRTSSGGPQQQGAAAVSPSHDKKRSQQSLPRQRGSGNPGKDSFVTGISQPAFGLRNSDHGRLLLQPETRPITQEQLVNEVKGIYAGLVMVEKKYVEIDQQLAVTAAKLSNEQCQALIAIHRTLLHVHHDFFLASQHPSPSPALRKLATKYAMPARVWRHCIHSFLELFRHRLPDSVDHMHSFIYYAYSMMALSEKILLSFEESWIECLGDLARYRMATEGKDLRDLEIWSSVARMWYVKAADISPTVGRIQHHLVVLARPKSTNQFFYYTKALVHITAFESAGENILLLLTPCLGKGNNSKRFSQIEASLAQSAALLFTCGLNARLAVLDDEFVDVIGNYISKVMAKFRVHRPEIVGVLRANPLTTRNDSDDLQDDEIHSSWDKPVFFLNTSKLPGTLETEPEGVFDIKSGIKPLLPEDFIMRGLILPRSHFSEDLFSSSFIYGDNDDPSLAQRIQKVPGGLWTSQIESSRSKWEQPNVLSQRSTTYHERRGFEKDYSSEQTKTSRMTNKNMSKLRNVSNAVLRFVLTYSVLSWIPVAFAQEYHDVPQMSSGSNWIIVLFLTSAAAIAGKMTKENPTHAAGFSAWIVFVAAVVWDKLDPGTKSIAVVLGLSPSLAVGMHQIWRRWHENDSRQQHRDVHTHEKSITQRLEEGGYHTRDPDDNGLFQWTDEPLQSIESTESPQNSVEEAYGTERSEERDSSPEPEPWNGTEGFRRWA